MELVSPFVLSYAYKRSLGPVLSAFFTALRQGTLLGARTPAGRVLFPACEYDPDTGAGITADDLVEVGPGGTVTSWTWIADPQPEHPVDVPFAWALVQLDGADTSVLHAVVAPEDTVRTGLRVYPRWASVRTGSMRDIASFGLEPHTAAAVEPAEVTRFKAPTRLDYVVTAGDVTGQFLKHILNKDFVGKRCPSCSKVYIPPRGSCPLCAVPTAEAVPLGQIGTVTTFSVIRIPFEGQMLEPPYACAHILLDGADVPLLHLVGDCDVDDVRMGMRVKAVWADQPEPTLASVRYFEPIDEPDVPYEQLEDYI